MICPSCVLFSPRAQQKHRHADAVLYLMGGGAQAQVSQEAMALRAHGHQVALPLAELGSVSKPNGPATTRFSPSIKEPSPKRLSFIESLRASDDE